MYIFFPGKKEGPIQVVDLDEMERNSFQIKETCVWPPFAYYHKLEEASRIGWNETGKSEKREGKSPAAMEANSRE